MNILEESLELNVGDSYRLDVYVEPDNAGLDMLKWESDNPDIAEVSDGIVTAKAAGTCRIKVSGGSASDYCDIEVLAVLDNPEVGNYYYSDGTYSRKLQPEKQVIGIVFWTGNPAEYDTTLRKEHPECTNGLVMALTGFDRAAWQTYEKRELYKAERPQYQGTVSMWAEENLTGYMSIFTMDGPDDNLNKMVGYNNTRVLEAFNAAADNSRWQLDIVANLMEHREKFPAPESSSGWYIPSPKELSMYAIGNYDGNIHDINAETGNNEQGKMLNDILSGLDGAEPLPIGGFQVVHWTSSEIVSNDRLGRITGTCAVDFGCSGMTPADRENPYSRMILAF